LPPLEDGRLLAAGDAPFLALLGSAARLPDDGGVLAVDGFFVGGSF
jgi:hypothetical protein